MPSFVALLRHALTTSGLSQRQFALRVGVTPAAVSKTLRRVTVPDWRRGPQWARALGLRGAQARAFVLALAIANAPAPVRQLVRSQARELARLR